MSMEQKNPPVSQVVYPNTRNWYVPGSQFHVNFSTPEDVFWFPLFSQVSFLPCRWQVGHEHLQLSEPITGSVVFRCSEDFQREKPLGKPSWKWDENEHIYIYTHKYLTIHIYIYIYDVRVCLGVVLWFNISSKFQPENWIRSQRWCKFNNSPLTNTTAKWRRKLCLVLGFFFHPYLGEMIQFD